MATLKDFRDERLRKLGELKDLGVNPYPADTHRTHTNKEIIDKFDDLKDTNVTVVGRIVAIRKFGKLAFIVIKDAFGEVQLFMRDEPGLGGVNRSNSELIMPAEIPLLDTGDFVESTGKVIKTQTGEVSIEVSSLRLLTKALRPMPNQRDGFSDIEARYRQRYVDLNINPEIKEEIITRSRVTEMIRQFLIEREFIELETPVLQPLYGGASARPFITYHHKLESDLYMRISNELYLKRAIVGGFERVFEFSRDFRNEGIDRSHNPEFTMLEFYWAYANYDDLMTMTEQMIERILMNLQGNTMVKYQGNELDFTPPFKRYTFREIILEKTSVDIDTITRKELENEIKTRKIDVDLKAPLKDLLDEFYKETCRKQTIQPFYLLDYPAEMIPLAKRKSDNPKYIASVQLVCSGFELLKAYNELNDPVDQLERLTDDQQGLEDGTSEESMNVDIDFIRALEYGMPPTAGWGLGIDRFVSFLVDRPAIKDVILFPTLRPEDYSDEIRDFYPHVKLSNSNIKFKRSEIIESDNPRELPVSAVEQGTRKLYLDDYALLECEAKVVGTEDLGEGSYRLILDQTCMYPGGGGQNCDLGEIAWEGGSLKLESITKDKEGIVYNDGVLDGNFPGVGSKVTCYVDSDRRLLNSRLHSAGHLIDYSVFQNGLQWKSGKGAHYPDMSFVEYSGDLDTGDTLELEQKIETTLDEYIAKGGGITALRVPSVDAAKYSEYIPEFVIKNYQKCHIAQYPDNFNICCGGTHVNDVSQIEKVKITKIKKKDGHIRVSYELGS